jgi:hypothetical protein
VNQHRATAAAVTTATTVTSIATIAVAAATPFSRLPFSVCLSAKLHCLWEHPPDPLVLPIVGNPEIAVLKCAKPLLLRLLSLLLLLLGLLLLLLLVVEVTGKRA